MISWSGSHTALPRRLPAPRTPVERSATVAHRFALNDTHDGYTAPYADWPRWERLLDVLALHGCNEVLVTAGQEAVYHRLLQEWTRRTDSCPLRATGDAHRTARSTGRARTCGRAPASSAPRTGRGRGPTERR